MIVHMFIALGIFLILGIITLLCPVDATEMMSVLAAMSLCAAGIFLFVSLIICSWNNAEYYYISGVENGVVVRSEVPTKYILMVNSRKSAWYFKDKVVEYKLEIMNTETHEKDWVGATQDENKIKEYFEPKSKEEDKIFGGK